MARVHGYEAIEYARAVAHAQGLDPWEARVGLRCYGNEIDDGGDVTIAEAAETASEDPSLIYIDVYGYGAAALKSS